MQKVKLGNKWVGENRPPYIIADIGSNHNGDMRLAKKLIDAAKKCGVDSAKFQSFDTESLISKPLYDKHISYPGDKHKHFGSLFSMVEKYYLRKTQHKLLANYCKKKNITFSSTPFSKEEVDLLDSLKVPFFKIASMDVTNHPLLEYIATTKKPVILSTGMATLKEIEQAMEIFRKFNSKVILLHCVAVYPPKYEIINLKNIEMLKKTFGVPVGFSDHSTGLSLSLAAVALGAVVIERHFTLDKKMAGWDHAISSDPLELKLIVQESRNISKALGRQERIVSLDEIEKKKEFRRSIVAASDLHKGQKIKMQNLKFKRPEEGGISPAKYKSILNKVLKRDIKKDNQIRITDFF